MRWSPSYARVSEPSTLDGDRTGLPVSAPARTDLEVGVARPSSVTRTGAVGRLSRRHRHRPGDTPRRPPWSLEAAAPPMPGPCPQVERARLGHEHRRRRGRRAEHRLHLQPRRAEHDDAAPIVPAVDRTTRHVEAVEEVDEEHRMLVRAGGERQARAALGRVGGAGRALVHGATGRRVQAVHADHERVPVAEVTDGRHHSGQLVRRRREQVHLWVAQRRGPEGRGRRLRASTVGACSPVPDRSTPPPSTTPTSSTAPTTPPTTVTTTWVGASSTPRAPRRRCRRSRAARRGRRRRSRRLVPARSRRWKEDDGGEHENPEIDRQRQRGPWERSG